MKIRHAMLVMTAGAVLLLANGCSKEAPPAGETPKAADQPAAASAAVKAVSEAASEAPKAAQAAATQAVAGAAATASAATVEVQALIDKAKGLVTDQKYQEALGVVQQLAGQQLTAVQQSLVDGLKAQIQAGLAKATGSDAAGALGNVLGGKR